MVIVRVDRIGDYVIWHDALGAYKNVFDGKRVLLICVDSLKSVVEKESFFTDIITYNHDKAKKSLKYLWGLLKKLHKINADIVISPLWRRNILGDIFVSSIHSSKKIGMAGTPLGAFTFRSVMQHLFNLTYTTLVESPKTENEIKAIEYFTQQIIAPSYRYGYYHFEVEDDFAIGSNKYAVVALSASNKLRIWSMDNFASIIDQIPTDYDIVLCGYGADDEKRARYVTSKVKDGTRIIDMIGRTTILQLIALISKSAFVIGNDSSAVHIAAAVKTPSICILPGAHFNRFVPYPEDLPNKEYNPRAVYHMMDCFGCDYKCSRPINESYECLRKITVGMVKKELNQLINDIENGRKN